MSGPSISRVLTELQQIEVLNEVLDDETISEYSSDDDSVFDCDYTQLVTPGTLVISDSESDNGTDERQQEIIHIRLGGVCSNFVWENYRLISRFTRNILECVWSPVRHC
jgi:hypothetical protein